MLQGSFSTILIRAIFRYTLVPCGGEKLGVGSGCLGTERSKAPLNLESLKLSMPVIPWIRGDTCRCLGVLEFIVEHPLTNISCNDAP